MTPFRGGPPTFPQEPKPPTAWMAWRIALAGLVIGAALVVGNPFAPMYARAFDWLVAIVWLRLLVSWSRAKGELLGRRKQHEEWLKAFGPPEQFPGHQPCGDCPTPGKKPDPFFGQRWSETPIETEKESER